MTEEDFWTIINIGRRDSNVTKSILDRIERQIMELPLAEMLDFAVLARHFINKAGKQQLAIAGGIICGLPNALGMDSFLYFRCWLILQGENVYCEALQEPDTLADVTIESEVELEIKCPFCEEFLYIINHPFACKSGGKGVESWKEVVPDWMPPKALQEDALAIGIEELDIVKITDSMALEYPRLWRTFRVN